MQVLFLHDLDNKEDSPMLASQKSSSLPKCGQGPAKVDLLWRSQKTETVILEGRGRGPEPNKGRIARTEDREEPGCEDWVKGSGTEVYKGT